MAQRTLYVSTRVRKSQITCLKNIIQSLTDIYFLLKNISDGVSASDAGVQLMPLQSSSLFYNV